MCFISPMLLCFLFLWNRCWIQGLILPEIFLWVSAPKLYTEGYVLNAFRPFLFLALCELFCLQEFSPLALLCVAFCDHCSVWPSVTIALCDLLWPLTPWLSVTVALCGFCHQLTPYGLSHPQPPMEIPHIFFVTNIILNWSWLYFLFNIILFK